MSCVQLSEGASRWCTPLACGPGHPELSKSYMDMASKLFTFTLHLPTGTRAPGGRVFIKHET